MLEYIYVFIFYRHNVNVIGFSADGDPRLLCAMMNIAKLDLTPNIESIERLKRCPTLGPTCVQDPVHIGTKLRNRFLNSSLELMIGDYIVTTAHIKMLIDSVPKEIHGLVLSDVYPEDRQNFNSLVKLMDDRVIQALKTNVPDCQATIMFLKLCKNVTYSYIQEDLKPLDRIYQIWSALYFLRGWRKWIQKSKNRLTENFLSMNAFSCIEINSHALIEAIVKLRSGKKQEMFLTYMFASQPCESLFRQLRSMGTANFTKINFTLHELLHLIARVEIMNKIAYSCKEIVSPRIQSTSKFNSSSELISAVHENLPSDENILVAMERGQRDALEQLEQFGIYLTKEDIMDCEIESSHDLLLNTLLAEEDDLKDGLGDDNSDDNAIGVISGESNENITTGQFIEIIDEDGSVREIRKSTFIWMISDSSGKLSSDRLKRVQGSTIKRQKLGQKYDESFPQTLPGPFLFKAETLSIGEWGVFKLKNDNISQIHESSDNCLIGFLTGFKIFQKDGSRKQYKHEYVSINANSTPEARADQKKSSNKKRLRSDDYTNDEIQVLAIWYTCNEDRVFRRVQIASQNENRLKIYVENYLATMKKPNTKKLAKKLVEKGARKDDNLGNAFSFFLPCEWFEYCELINGLKNGLK